MNKRISIILVIGLIAASVVWGSGGQAAGSGTGAAGGSTASQVNVTPTMTQLGLPLKTPITVKYWAVMNAQESQVMKSFAEKSMWQNMEKIANINIEFDHPSVAAAEAFNLLLASGDLPDIIQYNNGWKNVAGGLDGLINDKVIMDLTPYFNNNMPNMRKLLNDNPAKLDALMKTGSGKYWAFTKFYIDESCWAGPIIRKDYIDKMNLNIPTTIDEWYNVLKTFKANGVQIPLGFEKDPTFPTYGIFIGAWDVIKDFYVGTDKKIHYGPIEDGYRQFLANFSKWYSEGLIDPEFAAIDVPTYKSKAVNGIYGAFTGSSAEHFGAYNAEISKNTPGAGLVATPYPKLTANQTLRFRQQSESVRPGMWTAVSAKTKYAAEICKMFDYMYSPEGSILISYGNEGESYTRNAQGNPVATALLTNNPAGAFAALATKYCGRNSPFLTDPYECYFLDWSNVETAARKVWDGSGNYDGLRPSYELPPADTQAVNKIMTDVRTYVDEMYLKFMMGQEPLSSWDAYVANIKKMGIDDVLAKHNDAYAKFTGIIK
ncbi:MAG: extracellular solute-binding protein [Treponema sp.]|nr:extracellular solute-binding protein [Treponema sp.]